MCDFGTTLTEALTEPGRLRDSLINQLRGERDEARAARYGAENERDDAQAALDLAATRWDNTRDYVADLLGASVQRRDESHGMDALSFACAVAEVAMLEAVASFMDGQHDGSVTRG